MGYEHRITQLPVIKLLQKTPQLFSLEQCVYILEKVYGTQGQYGNEHSYYSAKITVKSKHTFSLIAHDVHDIKFDEDKTVLYSERASFTSINGPLPDVYTEKINALQWTKNYALSDFMNIFINRLSGVSYKISIRKIVTLQNANSEDTNIGKCLQALTGRIYKDPAALQCAYLHWTTTHSALGLRSIIMHFFQVPVQISQFVGAFNPLATRSLLGTENSSLSENAVLGRQFFDYNNAIKISIGPLDNSTLTQFEKDKPFYKSLIHIISTYLEDTIDYTLEFIPDVPAKSKLSNTRMGYNSWLTSSNKKYDNRYVHKTFI